MTVGLRTLALTLSALLLALAPAQAARAQSLDTSSEHGEPHPPDPFAGLYALPTARELGTTAGQFHAIGAAMLSFARAGVEPGVHGTLELMTFPYLGVRGSLQTNVAAPASQPLPVFVAKTGPSLHLLPYRIVDLSVFFEGGVAVVNALKKGHAPMAVASPGIAFDLWLSHWAFLRLEGLVDCGFYAQSGVAKKYVRFGSSFGVGLAI